MRAISLAKLGAACAAALMLSACFLSIPDPFGGPPLVLTGNLKNDLPGIQAYATALRTGAKADAADIRAAFITYCLTVDEAATAVSTVTPGQVVNATGGLVTTSAASQKISQAQQGVATAQLICAGGTATDFKTAFVNFAAAAEQIYAWIKD